jgi:hypothetical protein
VRRPTALVLLSAACFAVTLSAQELQVPDFVQLPGEYITPKKEPEVLPFPSIERVGVCVEDDPDLRLRAADLLALETRVQRDSAEVDSLADTLRQSDTALRGERAVFDESVRSLRATDEALEEMRSSVKRLGADNSTKEKVEQYNAAIDVYNAEVKKRNAQLAEVRRGQSAFTKKVAAHNAKVQEQHLRIDEFNARSAAFSGAANAFMADVAKFDSDCLRPGEP